jgi:uncharacterized protein YqeY
LLAAAPFVNVASLRPVSDRAAKTGASMRERIAAALKDSIAAEDPCRTATLRLILAALKDRDTGARDEERPADLDDEAEVMAVLSQMMRQRAESAQAYEEGGRLELAERERAELAVIREFLPAPMSAAEVKTAVDAAIAETHATSIRDMSKVVGALKARYAGRLDLATVGAQVKSALCAH